MNRNCFIVFSFFLAIPTMAAATGFKLLEAYKTNPAIITDPNNIKLLLIGSFIAFIVAMIAINNIVIGTSSVKRKL